MELAMSGDRHGGLQICHECDLLQRLPSGGITQALRCARCGAEIGRPPPESPDQALSLAVTALVLLILANVFPLMTMEIQGRVQQSTIVAGALELNRQGFWDLALLVGLTSIV